MEALNITPIVGWVGEGKILIATTSPASYVEKVTHEGGHLIADKFSFGGGSVLSPEQTRNRTLILTPDEHDWLFSPDFRRSSPIIKKELPIATSIAEKLLYTFTKGNFDLNQVEIFYGQGIEGFLKALDAKMTTDEKTQRTIEVPAYYTQVGCLNILRTTLATPEVPVPFGQPRPPIASAHRRAVRIAVWAYQRGWVLPSMLDRQLVA